MLEQIETQPMDRELRPKGPLLTSKTSTQSTAYDIKPTSSSEVAFEIPKKKRRDQTEGISGPHLSRRQKI